LTGDLKDKAAIPFW